ncbi:MAG: hypothetical protein AAF926_03015, partial [Pseudomonadota bacterium]
MNIPHDEYERRQHIVSEIRAAKSEGDVLSDRELLALDWAERNSSKKASATERIERIRTEKDGSVFIDAPNFRDTHSPRSIGLISGDYERLFWVTFLIGCEGVGIVDEKGLIRTRDNARLENTLNDLDSFYDFYHPILHGDIWTVGRGVKLKSPGFFNKVIRLENPSEAELNAAVDDAYQWVRRNIGDPEFVSLQINFFFSGHGYYTDIRDCGIVLQDGLINVDNIALKLNKLIPPHDVCSSPHRLD